MTAPSDSPTTLFAPAKAGVRLFFCNLSVKGEGGRGSQAPDQVRGDELVLRGVGA